MTCKMIVGILNTKQSYIRTYDHLSIGETYYSLLLQEEQLYCVSSLPGGHKRLANMSQHNG